MINRATACHLQSCTASRKPMEASDKQNEDAEMPHEWLMDSWQTISVKAERTSVGQRRDGRQKGYLREVVGQTFSWYGDVSDTSVGRWAVEFNASYRLGHGDKSKITAVLRLGIGSILVSLVVRQDHPPHVDRVDCLFAV